jgi:hypothetical protein
MLSDVLEKKLTSKVVRLGSRSADETISRYSLEQMELVAGKTRLDRTFGRDYRKLKTIEEDLKQLMIEFLRRELHSTFILRHLEVQYPEEYELLVHDAPSWVVALRDLLSQDSEGWQTANGKKEKEKDDSIYTFWRSAKDLELIESKLYQDRDTSKGKGKAKQTSNAFEALVVLTPEDDAPDEEPTEPSPDDDLASVEEEKELTFADLQDVPRFLQRFGIDVVPDIPTTTRNLGQLLDEPSPWSCSRPERDILHAHWSSEVKRNLEQQETSSFRKLREQHAEALAAYNEGKIEVSLDSLSLFGIFLSLLQVRRQLLQNVDIIGATTTGASKLTALLKVR